MKQSAGLLTYRIKNGKLEVLLARMGSPWWARKDKGAWTIPKGEYESGADPLANAKREFHEELGIEPPEGELIELGSISQKGGKQVTAWAVEADLDVSNIKSNSFELEWPPRSGQMQQFPEIDRAAYMDTATAMAKVVPGQDELIARLSQHLGLSAKPAEQSSLF